LAIFAFTLALKLGWIKISKEFFVDYLLLMDLRLLAPDPPLQSPKIANSFGEKIRF